MRLKVITYNIHKGFGPGKVKFVLNEIREALASTGADIVFLQEVHGENKRQQKRIAHWPDQPQFEYLADTLWPHFAYAKNAIYQAGHHGNAILSKFPIISHENISLTHITRASRGVLHGVIELQKNEKRVHILCIHLGLFQNERQNQLETLCERIKAHVPDSEPLIIAGDFNDWRIDAVNYLENDLGLIEVFKDAEGHYAKTFPAIRPTLRNDRIYYRNMECIECLCMTDKPWRHLSDHLPLMAVFEIDL